MGDTRGGDSCRHMAKTHSNVVEMSSLKSTNELKKKIQLYHSVKPFFTVSNPYGRQRHDFLSSPARRQGRRAQSARRPSVSCPADPAAGWAPAESAGALRCAQP